METNDLRIIPNTLNEAIIQLDSEFDELQKNEIVSLSEIEFISDSHFSVGMWLRNNWGLWKDNNLTAFFNNLGVHHPDDMSSIIMTCYYRHLKHQDYELDKQIQYYKAYWKKERL